MKDLAPYVFPLIFAALVLLNYLAQRIARWQKQQSAQQQEKLKPPPDKVRQGLEELKRRREQSQQTRKPLQRPREEPTPPRAGQPAERIRRVRAAQDEPLEVRQARARASRPDVTQLPIRASRAAGVRALLADRRSLRQSIVLMTVLGPCRAQEPLAGRSPLYSKL